MKTTFLLSALTAMSVMANSAFAEEGQSESQLRGKTLTILCGAAGPDMSSLGDTAVDSVAAIKFKLKERDDGLRVIEKFVGEIVLDTSHRVSEHSYVARFEDEKAVENKNYRPRVYRGYSQFKNINATDTTGSESEGMSGTFLLEKNLNKEHIKAVYQFQTGDSMGGVLHLSCQKQEQE